MTQFITPPPPTKRDAAREEETGLAAGAAGAAGADGKGEPTAGQERVVSIPVAYGGEYGPDVETAA